MESEFFGHKKGSFTGAHADKPGLFQAADGGTLFLDEVAELPLPMQVKLLRAIQEKSIRPVGANAEVNVDVRILSATHKNLAALVDDGRFRHDLYYRINVIELRVPPLRERLDDLPGLADRDPAAASPPPRAAPVPALSPEALEALRALSVPRQRARTGEHPRTRHGHGRRRAHRSRRPAPAQRRDRRRRSPPAVRRRPPPELATPSAPRPPAMRRRPAHPEPARHRQQPPARVTSSRWNARRSSRR